MNNCGYFKKAAKDSKKEYMYGCSCHFPVYYQGPTGPQGEPGSSSLAAFGGLYHDQERTISLVPGMAQILALAKALPCESLSLGANSLVIDSAGIYRVELMLVAKSLSGVAPLQVGVSVNGALSEPCLSTWSSVGNSWTVVSFGSIVSLRPGDWLALAISSPVEATICFAPGMNAQLQALRLGALA